jgi:hypothetical protein
MSYATYTRRGRIENRSQKPMSDRETLLTTMVGTFSSAAFDNNNNNYKALRMRPPHDLLQALSGECSIRRPEHTGRA